MRTKPVFIAAVAVLGVAFGANAIAKTTATSTIAQIKVVSKHHKSYSMFHGAVWMDHDKATTNYRWGGKQCGGIDLDDAEVALLYHAFRGKYLVSLDYDIVVYRSKRYRCITGFTLSRT